MSAKDLRTDLNYLLTEVLKADGDDTCIVPIQVKYLSEQPLIGTDLIIVEVNLVQGDPELGTYIELGVECE